MAAVPRRVLVVDDNADAIAVLAVALRRAGHEVHQARDGREALQLARRIRPELVFLDLGLPGLDGYAVARQIRLDPSLKDMRIIAVTGYAQESDREEARKAGFDHYLVKPVDLVFVKSLLG
jgi:CheY-like chemotaxis protein